MATETKQTLNYPHEFRPVPRFLIDVPGDWKVFEYPGALFAVSSVDPDQPWMNIVVSHERIVAGTLEDRLALRYTELTDQYDGVVIEPERGLQFGKLWFIARDMTYTDPDLGVAVSRLEMSATAPESMGLIVDDMFTITFIAQEDAVKGFADVVSDVIQSFRFV